MSDRRSNAPVLTAVNRRMRREFSDRLRSIMIEKHGNHRGWQKTAAAYMNVSHPCIHVWLAGKVMPRLHFLYDIAKRYRVNLHWLLIGEGPKYL